MKNLSQTLKITCITCINVLAHIVFQYSLYHFINSQFTTFYDKETTLLLLWKTYDMGYDFRRFLVVFQYLVTTDTPLEGIIGIVLFLLFDTRTVIYNFFKLKLVAYSNPLTHPHCS